MKVFLLFVPLAAVAAGAHAVERGQPTTNRTLTRMDVNAGTVFFFE